MSKPNTLSLYEIKSTKVSQNENKTKKVSQNKNKYKKVSQSEVKSKDLSQYKMVSPSPPMSAYLSLLANGAGGALTGHSTAAHRSLPPALQPGISGGIKTEGLSGWSTSVKKALSRTKYVTKEMMVKRTLRSVEAGVFELLCWECQKSRSYMDDDMSVCRKYTLVGKSEGIRPHVCREYTEVGKMYSAANSAQTCQTTAYSQLVAIILLTAGLARGPRSELSPIFSDNSTIYVHSDPIVVFSNSYVSSRLVKNVYMILPVALATLVQSFWLVVLFSCFF